MNLYIDTVTTTGQWLWAAPDLDPSQPPMIRVAAMLCDGELIVDRVCRLVTPLPGQGYVPPASVLQHGIDDRELMDKGVVLGAVLARMTMLLTRANLIVAHNIDFHTRVLRASFNRGGLPMPELPPQFCTMRKSTDIVRCKTDKNRLKFPRLAEAYAYFASEGLDLPYDVTRRGERMVEAVRTVHRGITAANRTLFDDAPAPPPAAA
jgi:DNA polymerase-3 subunit epsilon